MIRVLLFLALVAVMAFGVVWLADRPGRCRHRLAGLSHRDVGDGGGGRRRHRRAARRHGLVDRADHPALARPDRDVPQPPPRRARLSRDLARPDRGRRRRRRRGEARRRAKPSGSRRASRWRFCSTRKSRSSPATAPPPSMRSAPWRSATTPSCSACAACYIEAQRRKDAGGRARLRRGGRQCRARARLGRAGGAGIPLRGRRLGRGAVGARPQQPLRPDRQDRIQAPARGAADRSRARGRRRRARPRPFARARCAEARADARSRRGTRRTPARRGRRIAPRQPDHREGLGGQPASRSRRDLRASAPGRFRARAAGARAVAGAQGARPGRGAYRERAGGGAGRARRAGVRGRAERDPAAVEGADAARRRP